MTKVVLITGSTRGIGKAMALEFARNRYTILLNGTKKRKDHTALLSRIRKLSPESDIYYFDVSDPKQIHIAASQMIKKFDRVDILINNAGVVRNLLFKKMRFQDFDTVLKTNLYGTYNTSKEFIPSMVGQKWGRIINMSSISAFIGDFGQTNYSASKAAIIAFTKSLSKEVARYNITVNAIAPGLVNTEILKNVPKEYMQKMIEKIPLGRMAEPEEIAKVAIFLASVDSAYITGECININGGWL